MSSVGSSQTPPSLTAGPTQYQDHLTDYCRNNGMGQPRWQVMSDRRGGRTAWSSEVQVQGLQPVQARFWYDGSYVNSAKEDAAQVALQRLGQLPAAGKQTASFAQQEAQQQAFAQPMTQPQHPRRS